MSVFNYLNKPFAISGTPKQKICLRFNKPLNDCNLMPIIEFLIY